MMPRGRRPPGRLSLPRTAGKRCRRLPVFRVRHPVLLLATGLPGRCTSLGERSERLKAAPGTFHHAPMKARPHEVADCPAAGGAARRAPSTPLHPPTLPQPEMTESGVSPFGSHPVSTARTRQLGRDGSKGPDSTLPLKPAVAARHTTLSGSVFEHSWLSPGSLTRVGGTYRPRMPRCGGRQQARSQTTGTQSPMLGRIGIRPRRHSQRRPVVSPRGSAWHPQHHLDLACRQTRRDGGWMPVTGATL
jgi:hypothetical protein